MRWIRSRPKWKRAESRYDRRLKNRRARAGGVSDKQELQMKEGNTLNKRKKGAEQESIACDYLERRGVMIVERNYRTRYGEIDLIALHDGYLIFVEVKYRSGTGCGYPEEAVTSAKQRTICKVAEYYLYTHERMLPRAPRGIRYDVVAILGDQVRWISNAFEHHGGYY